MGEPAYFFTVPAPTVQPQEMRPYFEALELSYSVVEIWHGQEYPLSFFPYLEFYPASNLFIAETNEWTSTWWA